MLEGSGMLRRAVSVQREEEEEEGCAWRCALGSGGAVPRQTALRYSRLQIKDVIQTGPTRTGLCDSVVGEAVKN